MFFFFGNLISMSRRPPEDDDTDDQIVNEQVPRMSRGHRPSTVDRLLGSRDSDRKLRRMVLLASLLVATISITTSMWGLGSKIVSLVSAMNAAAASVRASSAALDSLRSSVRQQGERFDSMATRETRREASDSVRFAALERGTASMSRATSALKQATP